MRSLKIRAKFRSEHTNSSCQSHNCKGACDVARGPYLLILSFILVVICACGSGHSAAPQISSRCEPASPAQIETLRSAINDVQAGNGIANVYAVRSKDFEQVWMVAGQITGPGIEPGKVIGVWAIGGEKDAPSLCLSVDHVAESFSGYNLASRTKAAITMSSDGVEEAEACAGAANH